MAEKRTGFFPAKFLQQVWKRLSLEERRLAKEKKRLEEEDPALRPEITVVKPAEMVDEATEALNQERVEAEKGMISKILMETQRALSKIKIGRYGICESCGKPIDQARLKAYPQARSCLDCEKKLALKKGA